jgi:parallel beta-helix repeat protein
MTCRCCEVYGNTVGGIEVTERAEPTLRRCLVHENKGKTTPAGVALYDSDWGIRFSEGSVGLMEDCEASANGGVGIALRSGANPTLRNCKAYGHPQHGVAVVGATGTFDRMECYRNGNCGFLVQSSGNPKCTNSDFYDNGQKGAALEYGSKATFEDCKMRGNLVAALIAYSNCTPTVRRCLLQGSHGHGIHISNRSGGLFEDCDFVENKLGPTRVDGGCDPRFVGSQIR